MGELSDKKAATVSACFSQLLQRVAQVRTMMLDNGGEFAHHEQVAKISDAKIFFAKPYASDQRGTNGNTNGLIRRYWPIGYFKVNCYYRVKGSEYSMDISSITENVKQSNID